VLLQRCNHRFAGTGDILELKIPNILAAPVAACVVRKIEAHVGGNEEVGIVDAVQMQIARAREIQFLRFPVFAGVG